MLPYYLLPEQKACKTEQITLPHMVESFSGGAAVEALDLRVEIEIQGFPAWPKKGQSGRDVKLSDISPHHLQAIECHIYGARTSSINLGHPVFGVRT